MSGKQPDLSTPWSDWIWSEEYGCKYAQRYGPDGELEYDYLHPPEEEQETPRHIPEWPLQADVNQDANAATGSQGYTTSLLPSNSSSSSYSKPTYKVPTGYSSQVPVGSPPSRTSKAASFTPLESLAENLPMIPIQGPEGRTKMAKQINSNGDNANKHLDKRYVVIDDHKSKKFWKQGRVFMMLWTEPARSNAKRSSQLSTVWLGETAFSEIRRFVVIGEGHGNVICSPIHSYGGQATLKENLPDLEQHAIIHTSSEAPAGRCEYDAAGYIIAQEQLSKVPIRVIQELNHADGDLGDCSRINYAKIYTVEKYVRVLNIGRVHESSMDALLASSFFARPKDQPVQGPRRSAHKPRDNRERKEEPRDERDSNKRGQSSSSGGQHHHRRK